MTKIFYVLHIIFILFCVIFSLNAQEPLNKNLVIINTVKIVFGQKTDNVGADFDGGEHWKPLFFAVDKNTCIHIPDFYKNRIAVFNFNGKLKEAKPCTAGLSPRMNYFYLSPQGYYITISDYCLYLLNEKAELIWKKELGIGTIPEFIYAGEAGLFIVLPFGEKRTVVFDYANPNPLGRLGIRKAKEDIPLLVNREGMYFTPRLRQMNCLDKVASGAFMTDVEANLVYITDDNQSLWKRRVDQSEVFYLFSSIGKLLHQAIITFPSAGEGSGFWTVADDKLNIYKNFFYDDYMEVISYTFALP